MTHPAMQLAWTPFDPWHMLVLLLVALLLFGKRLPEVGRSLGRGIMEFKRGLREVKEEMEREPPPEPPSQPHHLQPPPPESQTAAPRQPAASVPRTDDTPREG